MGAPDTLVLKATAIVLTRALEPQLSAHCYHLPGHGGAKAAVRVVAENLANNTFVLRTDVKSYYANMDHALLFGMLEKVMRDARLLSLLWGYIQRTVVDGGVYQDIPSGIGLGFPLSPLMGALYLHEVDTRMAKTRLAYCRFMDDWVILAPTRWKLWAAIRGVRTTLAALKIAHHPYKTYIGRIAKGFDFLGYHLNAVGVSVAQQTVERFRARVRQLYEQGPPERDTLGRLGAYVRR